MTEKKPQTCYVELDIRSNTQPDFMMTKIPKGDKSFLNGYPLHVTKLPDRYIFTKEELQALLQKERREAAEKALNWVHDFEIECPRMHKQEYLNQHYPLPQPPKQ